MPIAVVYGVLAAMIWGGQPVVSKLGYRATMTADDLTFLRYVVSGTLMLPFVMKRGIWNACGLGWRRAGILMLIAGPVYSLVLIGGLTWAPASHGALIYPALTPIFTALFAQYALAQTERPSRLGMALLVAGVIAIGVENAIHASAGSSVDVWKGDLLFVAAAILWALYIGLMRKWQTDPYVVMSIVQVSGLVYVPIYLAFHGLDVFAVPSDDVILQCVYQGIIVSILSVTLFNLAVRELGATASMFTALAPLIGVGLSVWVLGESASVWIGMGTIVIVTGLTLSLKRKQA